MTTNQVCTQRASAQHWLQQGADDVMMGTKARIFRPIPNVSLEDLVPQDHFYRHVERSLDLSFVRELVKSCYAPIGRPSVASSTSSLNSVSRLVSSGARNSTNADRHDWIAELGRPDRAETHGSYQRQSDVWVNMTDPDATLMHKKCGGTAIGYQTHYVVDGGKARIILDALVTPLEVMDNQPMLDLLWHVCFRWHLQPDFACGDTTYGTLENIVALEDANIRAYTPLPDFDQRTPFFGKQRFTYEADHDQYRCPHGARLPRRKVKYTERVIVYQADAETCNGCPLKAKCTASDQGRMVKRHFDEAYLDLVRSYHETEAYKKAMRKRKVWVEPLVGEAKAWHGMERFRLRMLEKVNIEGVLIATGQNLKRLLSWRGWGRRWWPGGAIGVVIPADFGSNSMVLV